MWRSSALFSGAVLALHLVQSANAQALIASIESVSANANKTIWLYNNDLTKLTSTITESSGNILFINEWCDVDEGNMTGGTAKPNTWPVVGNITSDQIVWNTGPSWHRRSDQTVPNLAGLWYSQGKDGTKRPFIYQAATMLKFINENDETSAGCINTPNNVAASYWIYKDHAIHASISADGQRIDWENGTLWTRTILPVPPPPTVAVIDLTDRCLASYDDSWQTKVQQVKGSFLGIKHDLGIKVTTRALRHCLRLKVSGPNTSDASRAVEDCLRTSTTAAALAGGFTGWVSGGAAAVPAAIAALKATFSPCVAGKLSGLASSISITVTDSSEWTDWG
jgi:hypothetical protein